MTYGSKAIIGNCGEKTVAILGATGAVGKEALSILEEAGFPREQLRLFASARSRGKRLPYGGGTLTVEEATDDALIHCGADIILGMTGAAEALRFAGAIRESGAVFVDNSSAFRLEKEVPLVIPEVNAADIAAHRGILANPNCSTIITLTAVAPIASLSRIESMVVTTYQAVSGAGTGGLLSLEAETEAACRGEALPPPACFPYPIAGNLIPQIGDMAEGGYTTEEWKMQKEGCKILHLPELRVSCTCVRVPIRRCHSISVTLRTFDALSPEEVTGALAEADGVVLCTHPMPILAEGREEVFVGRIRKGVADNELSLFCCGDQLRKGAAGNALQIAGSI